MFKQTLAEIDDRHGIQWRFDTAQYTVAFWAQEEIMEPEDNFEFPEDVEFARQDHPAHWFCAFVGVFKGEDDSTAGIWKGNAVCVGYDVLGGCSYNSFREFLGLRDGIGGKISPGGYFPDMVRQALSEARAHEIRNTMVTA
jgi:hypothetical protein